MKSRLLSYLPVMLPAAIAFWLIDALAGSFFTGSGNFTERLVFQIPSEAIIPRVLALSIILLVSLILTRTRIQQRDLGERLNKYLNETTTLLDSLEEEVIYLDRQYQILWMNRSARDNAANLPVNGHPVRCYEFWHDRTEPCIPCPVRGVFEHGQSQSSEVTTPDGKTWLVRALPVKDEAGTVTNVLEIATDITRKKQAEEELRLSEQRYRSLFETMPEGVIYRDAAGRITEVNPSTENIFGLDSHQMLNRVVLDPPFHAIRESGEEFLAEELPSWQALKTGKPVNHIRMGIFNPREKDYRWVVVNAVPQFRPGEEKPSQVFITLYDITESRKMQELVRKSEDRFRSLIQNSTDLISVLDRDGQIQSISPSVGRILGYKSEELIGTDFFSLAHLDDSTLFRDSYFKKIRLPGSVFSLPPYRFHRKDGSWAYLETMINNLLYNPAVQGVVLNSRDVTEQKSMVEALKKSERDKEMILSGLSELLSFQDRNLTVQWVNRATIDTLKIPESELVGKKCYSLWPDQGEICPGCPVTESIARGETCEGEVTTKDGKTWWVRGNPVTDDQGSITGAVELRLDITLRKAQEEKIRYLTFHDPVTGLYNRLFFETELSRLDTARQMPLTVIVGDVNGLKLVNDAFGHSEGDRLLLQTSEILKQSCRREDIVARWGGDEFIILLPQTSITVARKIIERIREHCRRVNHFPIPISIALGTATKKNLDEPMKHILKRAEDQMYRHKRTESRNTRKLIFQSLEQTLRELTRENETLVRPLLSISLALGRTLKLSQKEMEELELLVFFRNLGKIALPREIVEKTDQLTHSEKNTLRNHPEIGYRIAQSTPELAPIAEEILSHHEYWDGTGYPQGLKGEDIPHLSRIVSVCESYIKLRLGIDHDLPATRDDALTTLRHGSGSLFDPDIVNTLCLTIDQQSLDPFGEKAAIGD